jgi:hypothetical protein
VSHNGREVVVVKENKGGAVGTVGSMTVTSRMKFLVVETTSEYTTQAGVVLKSIDDGWMCSVYRKQAGVRAVGCAQSGVVGVL